MLAGHAFGAEVFKRFVHIVGQVSVTGGVVLCYGSTIHGSGFGLFVYENFSTDNDGKLRAVDWIHRVPFIEGATEVGVV